MRKIKRIINIFIKQPISCILSLFIAVILMGGTLLFAFYYLYALTLPLVFDSLVYDQTGFKLVSKYSKVDLFESKFIIIDAVLENPSIYEDSSRDEKVFAKINRFEAKLDLESLLEFKILIKGFNLNIQELNCQRVNSSTYNLSSFLDNLEDIIVEKKQIEYMDLDIKYVSYYDKGLKDTINWEKYFDNICIIDNFADLAKVKEKLEESFAGAPFLYETLQRCFTKEEQ